MGLATLWHTVLLDPSRHHSGFCVCLTAQVPGSQGTGLWRWIPEILLDCSGNKIHLSEYSALGCFIVFQCLQGNGCSLWEEAPHRGLLPTRHTISSRAEEQKTIIQQLLHLKAAQASTDWGQPQALCCGFKLPVSLS